MNLFSSSDILGEVQVDEESRSLLKTITKWARIVAILGLVGAAITLIAALMGSQRADNPLRASQSVALIYIIPVVIAMVILNLFLLRFSTTTAESLERLDQSTFNRGISFLRMYFKTMGIIIIVIVSLCILIFIAFGIGAALRT